MSRTTLPVASLHHDFVRTNGIRLHVASAGPIEGPLAILLHGFPETWYAWRRQIADLAARGWRVLAPDQRGYARSDKPRSLAAYRIEALSDDVLGLIAAEGRKRACVVGHDWGGIVAWHLAATRAESLERVVILNAPHPAAFLRRVRRDPRQMVRSFYALAFQLPGLPEWWLRRRHFEALVRALRHSSRPGTFEEHDLDVYRESWSQAGALTGMLNWYRAAVGGSRRGAEMRVQIPLLLVWGLRDKFLRAPLAQESMARCDRGTLVLLPEATHWLHHEEPERVNELIGGFLCEDRELARLSARQ